RSHLDLALEGQAASKLPGAARVESHPGVFDKKRHAGFDYFGRLHGDKIAPVDRRHDVRPVALGKSAIATRRPFVVHPFPIDLIVVATEQVMERRPTSVTGHQIRHDLRQRAHHSGYHAFANLAVAPRRGWALDVDDGGGRGNDFDWTKRTLV